jgi:hypothetical protein
MLNTRSRPLQKDPKWVSLLRDREGYLKRRREAGVTGWIPYEAEVVLEGYFEDAESLPFKTDENGDLYQLTNPYWGCSYLLTIDHVVGFHPLPDLPNQALEPTSTSVTDPADAGSAPAVVVAHLER